MQTNLSNHKIMKFLVALFIIFLPVNNYYFKFGNIPLYFYQIIFVLIFLSFILINYKKLLIPKNTIILVIILSLYIISIINATNYIFYMRKILRIIAGIFIYIYFFNFIKKNKFDFIYRLLIYSGSIVILFSFFEWIFIYFDFEFFLFNIKTYFKNLPRADGTFTDPNHLSLYIGTILILIINKAMSYKINIFEKIITFIGLLVLFLTFSRSSILSFLISFIFSIIIYKIKYKKRFKIFNKTILFFILILIIIILFPNTNIFLDRILSSFNLTTGNVSIRFRIWKVAKNMIIANPIFGVGAGNFINNFTEYINDVNLPIKRNRVAHNSIIEIIAETGILSAILILLFIAIFIFKSILVIIKSNNLINVNNLMGLVMIIIFISFVSIFLSNIFYKEIFWLYIGSGYAILNNIRKDILY